MSSEQVQQSSKDHFALPAGQEVPTKEPSAVEAQPEKTKKEEMVKKSKASPAAVPATPGQKAGSLPEKVTPKDVVSQKGKGDKDKQNQFNVSMAEADDIEVRDYSILTKCAAEFVCVLIFVFVGTLQAQGVTATYGDGVVHAAFAHGVAIFVLAAAFGGISGAHINPAVTLGVTAVGKLNPIHAVFYMASQLAGGFIGACITRACVSAETYIAIQGGATLCGDNVAWFQGLIVEVMTTFMLVQSVLLTAVDTSTNMLAPLAIGFTLIIDIFAGGNISGASMNPARSFGPNIAGQIFISSSKLNANFWSYHWIYYVGPFVGALLAAALYRTFFARDNRAVQ